MRQGKIAERFDSSADLEWSGAVISREEWIKDPDAAFELWITSSLSNGDREFARNSIAMYGSMLRAFQRFLSDCRPKQNVLTVNADQIMRFLDSLEGRGHTLPRKGQEKRPPQAKIVQSAIQMATKRRYAFLLSKLMVNLIEVGCRQLNPFHEDVPIVAGYDLEPTIIFLSEPEDLLLQDYLLNRLDTSEWWQKRRRIMLLFILATGVNVGEATAAAIDDFMMDSGTLYFCAVRCDSLTKRRIVRYRVPIPMFCCEPIRDWLDERRTYLADSNCDDKTHAYLAFPRREAGGKLSSVAVYFSVNVCLHEIGFQAKDMGPRILRYTFLRRQILQGLSDEAIMSMCGLTTAKTVRRMRDVIRNFDCERP
ncbi:tyrosine-type recombinase/integrase [Paraburkholderia phymatum]|uniref:Tyrosine-type recombinase/integrase n=1 Tax=Paraburkholderia phymatum TaxID=148447 RepID=A0ACC6TXR8_9BURK